jgi:iron(III) transport system ATP-binding protein
MSEPKALEVQQLEKAFVDRRERVAAVHDVSFEIQPGLFYTLLGPSGCGKTTTLRCVAGLERPDAGRISIDGQLVNDPAARVFVPPHQRFIGMVFQSYAIWPHMDVFGNVAYPLRHAKEHISSQEISTRVREALSLVQLDGLEKRMATRLSGGQQQRLALARALVRRPKLLLLDEPLSNLDAQLRVELRVELRTLQRQLGLSTLYVTHDQLEALSMSNRIAVMSSGQIVQEGNPREIYEHPNSDFVARFVGTANFVPGTVSAVESDGTVVVVETAHGKLLALAPEGVAVGDQLSLTMRPENIRVHTPSESPAPNSVRGQVDQVMFFGEYLECRIRLGSQQMITRQHPSNRLRGGDDVDVECPPELITVLSDRGVAGAHLLSSPALAEV